MNDIDKADLAAQAVTLQELEDNGVLKELARRFREPDNARALLMSIGYPEEEIPNFSNANPHQFWRRATEQIVFGIIPNDGGLGRLMIAAGDRYPGCSAFSRYSTLGKDDGAPTPEIIPRLLVAIAAPTDCEQYGMANIDREAMHLQLEKALRPLESQMEWDFVTAPATLSRLRTRLFGKDFHALHLVAHSYINSRRQTAVLVLEKDDGNCDFVDEEDLSKIFLGERSLGIVTLITCQGDAQSFGGHRLEECGLPAVDPLSGLGRRLVESGLPPVISMQETVSFETAVDFSEHFYRSLARCGSVNAAVNEARHQLFLTDQSLRWSDPVLFMRLEDGANRRPAEETVEHDGREAQREEPSGSRVHVNNQGAKIRDQYNAETINVNSTDTRRRR